MIRKLWRWLWGSRLEGELTLLQRIHLLLDFIAYWIRRVTTNRYVLELEARVRHLEAQNAAHLNTIFGLRGLPPLAPGEQKSYAVVPAVMQQGTAIRPKVAPIMPRRAHTADRERAQETMRDAAAKTKAATDEIAARLQKEIQDAENRYKAARGEGLAIPAGADGPVNVHEPVVELEEGNDADS